MPDSATCKTCPWWQRGRSPLHSKPTTSGTCHKTAPSPSAKFTADIFWPVLYEDEWCGSHPDRQPRIDCATTTLLTREPSGPTAADMRRIVDALEKMASRAARGRA